MDCSPFREERCISAAIDIWKKKKFASEKEDILLYWVSQNLEFNQDFMAV